MAIESVAHLYGYKLQTKMVSIDEIMTTDYNESMPSGNIVIWRTFS